MPKETQKLNIYSIKIKIFIAFTFCKIMQIIYLQQFSSKNNIKCYNTGLMDELGLFKFIYN